MQISTTIKTTDRRQKKTKQCPKQQFKCMCKNKPPDPSKIMCKFLHTHTPVRIKARQHYMQIFTSIKTKAPQQADNIRDNQNIDKNVCKFLPSPKSLYRRQKKTITPYKSSAPGKS